MPTKELTMAIWYVYLLRCSDGTLYTGITTDIGRRLKQHNNGTASKYTRGRRPCELIGWFRAGGHSYAAVMEAMLKALPMGNRLAFFDGAADTRGDNDVR